MLNDRERFGSTENSRSQRWYVSKCSESCREAFINKQVHRRLHILGIPTGMAVRLPGEVGDEAGEFDGGVALHAVARLGDVLD